MRRTVIVVALLAAVLALPAGAGAGNTVTLRLGDGFAVKQSHILCAVQLSKTLVPGQKLVACYFWGAERACPEDVYRRAGRQRRGRARKGRNATGS